MPNPVHPHVCGEHYRFDGSFIRRLGSSPRVWGTSLENDTSPFFSRFIPTCVGNILFRCLPGESGPVHPHVCGEHAIIVGVNFSPHGSSPRVWGTCYVQPPGFCNGRFIPTCVGNMKNELIIINAETVHPHVCGEHFRSNNSNFLDSGSSPRVWGTLNSGSQEQVEGRFIPTCVGNMGEDLVKNEQTKVHPHVCGEHHVFFVCF